MTNQLPFDALVEGNLKATINQIGVVNLYQLKEQISAYLAQFADERTFCDLIGGYQSVAVFNDQMAKKREEFGK